MQADAVLLNPKANAGSGAGRWKDIRSSAAAVALGLDRAPTFDGTGAELAVDARGFLRDELLRGARRFVIAGGDGTVNLFLSAYLNVCAQDPSLPRDAVFGAVGIGSSNDFHKPFDQGSRQRLGTFPCRLNFDRAVAHDVGVLETTPFHETRFFFVNASMGVTAEANDRFNRGSGGLNLLKRSWVDGAIVGAALGTFAVYENREIRIQIDEEAAVDLLLTNLSVLKSRHFSGSFHYEEGPALDDGLLGVRICIGMSRFEMLAALKALSNGRFLNRPKTDSRSASVVQVQAKAAALMAVETDGEVVMANSCRFSVRPKGVYLCP